MKPLERIIGIYYRPGEVFQYLSERPDWVVPFMLVLITSLLIVSFTLPTIILPEQTELARERLEEAGLSDDQIEARVEAMTGKTGFIIGIVGVTFIFLFLLFGRAGIFLGIFSVVGEKSSYKQSLSIVSYAMMVHIIDSIIKGFLMYVKQTSQVYTSLALFMPGGDPQSKPFQLLGKFDLFTLWELSLLAIGFSVIYKISLKKTSGIVFGLWTLWVLLSVLLGGTLQFG